MPTRIATTIALCCSFLLHGCTSSNNGCSNSGGDCFDGQSHWLTACFSSEECGPYECICGICGTPCDEDDPCDVAGRDTVCIASDTSSVTALCGPVKPATDLCLEECTEDGDCGEQEKCLDGACIPVVLADAYLPVDPCARGTHDGDALIYTSESLASVEGYTSIAGDLEIVGTDLTDLEALQCLTSIAGGLAVVDNESLASLNGLGNLESVMGVLNDRYQSDGSSYDSLGPAIEIAGNNALTSLKGLDSLSSIGGDIQITGNENLTSLEGLNGLTSIDGGLGISQNVRLNSLAGLENLTTVKGILAIDGSDPDPARRWVAIDELKGLGRLESVGENLAISATALSDLDELGNLSSVGGYLAIFNNDLLTNLDGFNNLTTVGGDLGVSENDLLTNLDGFNNLTTVGGGLGISENDLLNNLDGLSSIETVGGNRVSFEINASLPTCEVQAFVDRLADYSGEIATCENLSDECGEAEPCP